MPQFNNTKVHAAIQAELAQRQLTFAAKIEDEGAEGVWIASDVASDIDGFDSVAVIVSPDWFGFELDQDEAEHTGETAELLCSARYENLDAVQAYGPERVSLDTAVERAFDALEARVERLREAAADDLVGDHQHDAFLSGLEPENKFVHA